ncbi:hypothetical protein Neut_0713 [Nitrosomonas eutropha C91]|uniref:Uncharacterized protein n=3 Tax=Nitrosomonas eutropha TaxID=916 RepID=A0ABX5M7Q1_9PROT|nr:hypothetical protein Neut_0713 [Nitrosomonas eutropha C91]PXV82213.1 hypothetical protein C8R14_10935 [Nitrosomonas eutropha]SCX05733.1 hypothetical protein SAMN05216379_103149 [Nitrosomonas eutropha]SEI81000.1 hypothetical protein SAMN05216318_1126 [Nitrosomonas eutropha]
MCRTAHAQYVSVTRHVPVAIGVMRNDSTRVSGRTINSLFASLPLASREAVRAAFMTTLSTPVENMPVLLQWLSQTIPLTHFLIIIEGCFLKALPPWDILANLWPLAAISLTTLPMVIIFTRNRLQ